MLDVNGSNIMKGDLKMGGKEIIGLADPTGDGQAANKRYVDSPIASGSVTKKYVDDENARQDIGIADNTSKSYVDDQDDKLLPLDGSRFMTGGLEMGNNRINRCGRLTMENDGNSHI